MAPVRRFRVSLESDGRARATALFRYCLADAHRGWQPGLEIPGEVSTITAGWKPSVFIRSIAEISTGRRPDSGGVHPAAGYKIFRPRMFSSRNHAMDRGRVSESHARRGSIPASSLSATAGSLNRPSSVNLRLHALDLLPDKLARLNHFCTSCPTYKGRGAGFWTHGTVISGRARVGANYLWPVIVIQSIHPNRAAIIATAVPNSSRRKILNLGRSQARPAARSLRKLA